MVANRGILGFFWETDRACTRRGQGTAGHSFESRIISPRTHPRLCTHRKQRGRSNDHRPRDDDCDVRHVGAQPGVGGVGVGPPGLAGGDTGVLQHCVCGTQDGVQYSAVQSDTVHHSEILHCANSRQVAAALTKRSISREVMFLKYSSEFLFVRPHCFPLSAQRNPPKWYPKCTSQGLGLWLPKQSCLTCCARVKWARQGGTSEFSSWDSVQFSRLTVIALKTLCP